MMTKNLIAPLILVVALAMPGCQKEQTATGEAAATTASEMTPEQLGELGAAIKKQPDQAQRLLAEKGLSEESFEQAIRRVTEDPAASKRYAEAYRKAS
jgi:hypothetical protein